MKIIAGESFSLYVYKECCTKHSASALSKRYLGANTQIYLKKQGAYFTT